MATIQRSITRIARDIAALRNIDAYLVGFIGVALLAVDLLGNIDIPVQLNIIIAALVVLVFRATTPVERKADLNDVLRNRSHYGQFRDFLKGGQTLWIYSPSAVNILRDPTPIRDEILERGGELKVLLQNPLESVVVENLQRQLDIAAVDLQNDIHVSTDILKKLKTRRRDGAPYNVRYGFLTYSPGFSMTIVDAERANGRLIIEFFGYQNEFIGSRMHVQISRRESEYWFEYWVEQYREMLASATYPESDSPLPNPSP